MNEVGYVIKFGQLASDFGVQNAFLACRYENGELVHKKGVGRYVMPWRFVCESVYEILREEFDSIVVLGVCSSTKAHLEQRWEYFKIDQLLVKNRINILFVDERNFGLQISFQEVLGFLKKQNFTEDPKRSIDFLVVNRQRNDLAHKPVGALVLLRCVGHEKKMDPVLQRNGNSTEVIRQALINAVNCLKMPCHINIYMEPTIGLKTTYFGDKGDSLDVFYEAVRSCGHSFVCKHFNKHHNYIAEKEYATSILRRDMKSIENE